MSSSSLHTAVHVRVEIAFTIAGIRRMGNDGFRMELDVGAKVVERDQFRLVGSRSLVEHSTNGEGRELFEDVWDKGS